MKSFYRPVGYLCAAFTTLVWGSTVISSKVLLSQFSPLQIMVTRFALAELFLWLLRPQRLRLEKGEEKFFLLMGVCSCSLYIVIENTALLYTQAANVSILLTTAPIFTAILAHFFTDEKLNGHVILGFLVAFAGVVLVVFNGAVVMKLSPKGDLLSILAALLWAVYSVTTKRFSDKYDSILLTRRIILWALVTGLPFLLMEHRPYPFVALTQPVMLFNLLFLGLLASAVCYMLWNEAFRRLGVVITNSFVYATPFVTMAAGFLFLQEAVSLAAVVGTVLITIGVIFSGRKPKKAIASVQEKDAQP